MPLVQNPYQTATWYLLRISEVPLTAFRDDSSEGFLEFNSPGLSLDTNQIAWVKLTLIKYPSEPIALQNWSPLMCWWRKCVSCRINIYADESYSISFHSKTFQLVFWYNFCKIYKLDFYFRRKMALDQNLYQTATCFGCVGISMYSYGFSVPQMRKFCLFTYPPRSKWASSEKMNFLPKMPIYCKSIAGPLRSIVQAYTQSNSFGGSIKLIICQIRHVLSITIHEISTSWKKTLDGGLYTKSKIFPRIWGTILPT